VDPLLISAASGMKARMESLDMLANNIANSGTSGFKADREFYNLYQQELPLVENRWTDFSQGTVLATGNALNLALSGPGFFALNGPAGTVYTRNGNFQISKSNQLETPDGYTLRNTLDQGRPIRVDPAQDIVIGKDGTVAQGGQPVGKIEIGQIPTAADQVAKLGTSYFALVSGAGTATPVPATEVLQGQLEQSNVPVADFAVRLVNVMRQFEMLQKAMNIGSQMSKEAIQEVARVG
jgi:flagellar basal-body rod protein FlgF